MEFNIMKCNLCLQDKPLIKKSHIIPNFLYKSLFGKSHRLVNINLSDFSDKKYQQTGYFDKFILCQKCDNEIIGALERYASNTIYSTQPEKSHIIKEVYGGDNQVMPYIRYKNLDFTKIKLFLLSLLWRSHISKGHFFREINLLPHLAEKIRDMIFTNNGGNDDELEIVMLFVDAKNTRPTKSIIEPRYIPGEKDYYVFHINEIMYHFNVSENGKESLFEKCSIKKDGIMDIAIIPENFKGYFDSYIGKPILLKSNPQL